MELRLQVGEVRPQQQHLRCRWFQVMSGNGTSRALRTRQQALPGIARKPSCSQEHVGFAGKGELGVSIPLGQSAAGFSLQCPSSSITSPGLSVVLDAGDDHWTCGMS